MTSTLLITQMKFLTSIAAAAVIGTSLLTPKSAEAKPFIYVDNYSYGGTTEQCLKNAQQVLKNHNFDSINEDISLQKERVVSVTGYHQKEYLTVEIQCDQKMGVTVLGVSGLDNKITYETYKKLHKANW